MRPLVLGRRWWHLLSYDKKTLGVQEDIVVLGLPVGFVDLELVATASFAPCCKGSVVDGCIGSLLKVFCDVESSVPRVGIMNFV